MDSSSAGHPVGPLYALVSYIPGPLGEFLNGMRGSLVPSCHLLSHLTLLPPRVLHAPREALDRAFKQQLPDIEPFEVTLGSIEVFEETRVVYISLAAGCEDAKAAHAHLAQGDLWYKEPWPYHPHITLAQEFPADQFDELLAEARDKWAAWPGPRSFPVEDLVFVRNRDANHWDKISEYSLPPRPEPVPVGLKTAESAAPLLP